MNEVIKDITLNAIDTMKLCISKQNNDDAKRLATDILSVSLKCDSKTGVLIGEILENAIIQHSILTRSYNINREQLSEEINSFIKLIEDVRSAIQDYDEMNICNSLADLRMYVTRQQLEVFPTTYTEHPRRLIP